MPCLGLNESDASMRHRLVNSLSNSFPGSVLTKALKCIKDEDADLKDPFSSSCFAELCLDREVPDEDEELTSLTWLQDSNLLKDIKTSEDKVDIKENADVKLEPGYAHIQPIHGPYNPYKHVNSKPPYSFSCLIFMALESSPTRMLPVKDIYEWILNHFPYFHNALSCWKNSVRHNLSLNKCFRKVEKDRAQAIGKGSFWCVDPHYRPNLLKGLHSAPHYPYCQLQMLANPSTTQQNLYTQGLKPQPLQPGIRPNCVSSYSDIEDVAKTLVSLKTCKAKTDDASFAQGLKRKCGKCSPPRQVLPRREQVICTNYPTMDHTYSITQVKAANDECMSGSPGSFIDEGYDFGMDNDIDKNFIDTSAQCHRDNLDSEGESGVDEVDGCFPSVNDNNSHWTANQADVVYSASKCHRFEENSEEERKRLAEGADALLNLAGICLL